ncbi:family 31 glycoside hydrolase [Xylariaceae sp. FL1019]|nr:family 31 glycoside hydrolase [Xylariaceae sp. FL1019]
MMRELVDYLHGHDQHYVMMVDPQVAVQDFPGSLQRGIEDNIFLLRANGSIWEGVVWPGITAFPDWFSENITKFWNNEFAMFFDKDTGVDIDALWIDLNEPSNFPCNFPCDDPYTIANGGGYPPEPPAVRTPPRALPGFPCDFQPEGCDASKREVEVIRSGLPPRTSYPHLTTKAAAPGQALGLPGRDLLFPKYAIHNKAAYMDSWNAAEGGISNKTVNTDVIHQNGLAMYDTHNIFGTMMSSASRDAMIARRPEVRPMIITRSTFAGAGKHVGKWLGDNISDWDHYRLAIRSMLAFAAVYQVPMVGTDTCGFGGNTTEQLCARWAALSAFAPFYRVHNELGSIGQELYRWAATTESGRKNIAIRYRLLDYFYTALHQQSVDGTPSVNPMMFLYPKDKNTYALDLQYFYGPGILVAPVTAEDSTNVSIYLPDDVFYDWYTHKTIEGEGKDIVVENQEWADIPLYMRGGVIYPVRAEAGMTTTEVRTKPFELIVAVGRDGKAEGSLYLDDGVSLEPAKTSNISFKYARGALKVSGTFGYTKDVKLSKVTFLGLGKKGKRDEVDSVTVEVDKALTGGFTVDVDV